MLNEYVQHNLLFDHLHRSDVFRELEADTQGIALLLVIVLVEIGQFDTVEFEDRNKEDDKDDDQYEEDGEQLYPEET